MMVSGQKLINLFDGLHNALTLHVYWSYNDYEGNSGPG